MKITVIAVFTCYNRKEKTVSCIKTLVNTNPDIEFKFVVVDDNSNDGTIDAILSMKNDYAIELIKGDGNLYYSGGMRKALDYIYDSQKRAEYVLLLNDDVQFFERSIEKMILKSTRYRDSIIAGATCDSNGHLTYGPLKVINKRNFKYNKVDIESRDVSCDSFNGNCVLIPFHIYMRNPKMDKAYIHTLGDYDYGFGFSGQGIGIFISDEYVGECEHNSLAGTWNDANLSKWKRLKIKESAKGAPIGPWLHYLLKNWGVICAIKYTLSPYINILLH